MQTLRSLLSRPRNTAEPAGQLDAFLRHGSTPTYAGVDVNPNTAMTIAAVFDAVRIISEDIGKLPVIVYERGEQRARAEWSPHWRLLHDKPNAWQSSQQFRELLTAWAVLRGNGYAFKLPLGSTQVRELVPIPPDRVEVEQLDDYEVVYHVRLANNRRETYTRRDILHLMGPSANGYAGMSVVTQARQSFGLAMGLERHGATLFGNGAKPGGVLKHPGTLSAAAHERLAASLAESHTRENAHKTLILEEGMDWTQVGLNNEDSQFLESRQFSVVEVARWFRLPPHKLGELGRATWANIEQQQIEYQQDVQMVWGQRWDNAFNGQVIGSTANVYAETLLDAALRATTKERYEAYMIATGRPWMAAGEVRRRENLPPLDGLDEVVQPLNMGTPSQIEQSNDATGGADGNNQA